mmetsp:Transcript_677/g.907  ORF Transcript_677/g.907 Transcript_677/m.907 type:complete len:363 (-) Transcript_677:1901-2989(-)
MEEAEKHSNAEEIKLKRFKLLKQKYLHSSSSVEDVELREYFHRLVFMKTRLKEVQKGFSEWTEKLSGLANSAKSLSAVVETSDDVVRTVSRQMKENKSTELIMNDLERKLQLVENLLQERQHIKLLKLNLDRAERKYQQVLSNRRVSQKRRSKRQYKLDIAAKGYNKASNELLGNLKFVMDASHKKRNGQCHIKIITPEINAFVAAQAQILLECQQLINGPYDGPSDHYAWENLYRRVEKNADRALERQKSDKYSKRLRQKISKSKNQSFSCKREQERKTINSDSVKKHLSRGTTNRNAESSEKFHLGMQNLCVQEMLDVSESFRRNRAETNESSEYEFWSDDAYSDYDIDASFVVRNQRRS